MTLPEYDILSSVRLAAAREKAARERGLLSSLLRVCTHMLALFVIIIYEKFPKNCILFTWLKVKPSTEVKRIARRL